MYVLAAEGAVDFKHLVDHVRSRREAVLAAPQWLDGRINVVRLLLYMCVGDWT